jgi:hypothetical protein
MTTATSVGVLEKSADRRERNLTSLRVTLRGAGGGVNVKSGLTKTGHQVMRVCLRGRRHGGMGVST